MDSTPRVLLRGSALGISPTSYERAFPVSLVGAESCYVFDSLANQILHLLEPG